MQAVESDEYATPECRDGFQEVTGNRVLQAGVKFMGCKLKRGLGGVLPGLWACSYHWQAFKAWQELRQ